MYKINKMELFEALFFEGFVEGLFFGISITFFLVSILYGCITKNDNEKLKKSTETIVKNIDICVKKLSNMNKHL